MNADKQERVDKDLFDRPSTMVYNVRSIEAKNESSDAPNIIYIGGINVTAREIIKMGLDNAKIQQADLAAMLGWSPQTLSNRLRRNAIKADELLVILDRLGLKVNITDSTGEEVKPKFVGMGHRIKAMVDSVKYDTSASSVLANSFYSDGVNMYHDGFAVELYIDDEGRYFFAEYTNIDGVKDRITPVSASGAAEFIKKYGTDIMKTPKQ